MVLSLEQTQVASAFPEVTWSLTDQVCIYRPEGVLTSDVAARLVSWLAEMESDLVQPFNRFSDLSHLQASDIPLLDLANVAFWRRATYSGPTVKSAFLARSPASIALANAYKGFMTGSKIQVAVFIRLEDAASWLGVSPESLTRPDDRGSFGGNFDRRGE